MIELYEIFAGKVNYNITLCTATVNYCQHHMLPHTEHETVKAVYRPVKLDLRQADDPTDGTGDQTWQEKLVTALLCAISFPPANTDISISISQTHYCYQSSDCH